MFHCGFRFTINSPTKRNISSIINRIAIKSNIPGAEKANKPVEKVSTKNNSGPSSNIFFFLSRGWVKIACFVNRNLTPATVIIRKYI